MPLCSDATAASQFFDSLGWIGDLLGEMTYFGLACDTGAIAEYSPAWTNNLDVAAYTAGDLLRQVLEDGGPASPERMVDAIAVITEYFHSTPDRFAATVNRAYSRSPACELVIWQHLMRIVAERLPGCTPPEVAGLAVRLRQTMEHLVAALADHQAQLDGRRRAHLRVVE
jgi:hypothetical protein